MSKHNFKALQTFRGWGGDTYGYVYGYLSENAFGKVIVSRFEAHKEEFLIPEESIGIYTGKDDKNGTPIFAGLPEEGNIGWDILLNNNRGTSYPIEFNGQSFVRYWEFSKSKVTIIDDFIRRNKIEVIGTQYEQYLKETK